MIRLQLLLCPSGNEKRPSKSWVAFFASASNGELE